MWSDCTKFWSLKTTALPLWWPVCRGNSIHEIHLAYGVFQLKTRYEYGTIAHTA